MHGKCLLRKLQLRKAHHRCLARKIIWNWLVDFPASRLITRLTVFILQTSSIKLHSIHWSVFPVHIPPAFAWFFTPVFKLCRVSLCFNHLFVSHHAVYHYIPHWIMLGWFVTNKETSLLSWFGLSKNCCFISLFLTALSRNLITFFIEFQPHFRIEWSKKKQDFKHPTIPE